MHGGGANSAEDRASGSGVSLAPVSASMPAHREGPPRMEGKASVRGGWRAARACLIDPASIWGHIARARAGEGRVARTSNSISATLTRQENAFK